MSNIDGFSYFYCFPNLSESEEKDLFEQIKLGNEFARESIINSHLKLVLRITKKYLFLDQQSVEDIVQEGVLGLIESVDRFDLSQNTRFSSFATKYIECFVQNVRRRTSSCVHVPTKKLGTAFKLEKFIEEYKSLFFREPSYLDMSMSMGMSEKDIEDLIKIIKSIRESKSNSKDNGYDPNTLDNINGKNICSEVQDRVNEMNDMDRKIFNLRYFEEKSWREIGKEINISHEGVRKRHLKIINTLQSIYA